MAKMVKLVLRVNGVDHDVGVDPSAPLVYVLRNVLGLRGTKLGCGLEQCGACAVLADGRCVPSCVRPVSEFVGQEITTIEGLGQRSGQALSPVQQAFVQEGAAQCGYCTPGMIIATTALLTEHSRPSLKQMHQALTDHICRCGSYAAISRALKRLSGEASETSESESGEKPAA